MRQNKVTLIIGQRGSGKTSWIKELLYKIRVGKPKTVIFDEFDSDVWHTHETYLHPERANHTIPQIKERELKGLRRGFVRLIADEDKIGDEGYYFDFFNKFLRNANLLIEDASRILEGRIPKSLGRLVFNTKQTNIDLYLVFHSLQDTPPRLLRNCNYIVLFKTQDEEVPPKAKSPLIKAAFEKVKAHGNPYHKTLIQVN